MVKATVTWKDGRKQTAYAADWQELFEKLGDGEIQNIVARKIKISDLRQGKERSEKHA